ncbi:oligosaccharide flippase family protein [Marinobacter sp. HL-58]|uniref:oligosaccharide flippase family protein n=1 Tax=Marinobacter sp. HL-58 TaxID=1479237 RepID=UPI000486B95F|nr:oligosaccharide flippase family protein [Marinobacter sp. HL-58]KPP97789.1 MAG: polysaccharide flippase [Marinobacter sp. HL-58]
MIANLAQRLLSSSHGDGLKAQLVRGALGVGGLKLLSLPLTLATSILLARGLGPEGYGQYVFVLAVISLLALPVGPGLGQLVTREVAKCHHGKEWGLFRGLLRRAHQWVILGSALMAVVIALLAFRNASWTVDDRWALLSLATFMLPLLGLNALRSSTLRGLRNVFYAQLPELLARPGLHLVIAGGLLAAGILNPATALASQIVATALAFGVGAWLLWRLKPAEVGQARPDYRHGEWGRALLPFTLLAAVGTLNGQIGILALGWLGTDEDVAALQVAMSGSMLVVLSLTIVNMVIGPHITRAHRDNDKPRLQRLSRQSARAALAVALPIALPLILLGGPIVELVYGEVYRDTVTLPLAILAVGQLVNVAFGSVGMFLIMSGFERDTLNGQIVALLINAIAAVVLIPPFGAVGAALAVAIGLATWNLILAIRFVQRLGLRPSAF